MKCKNTKKTGKFPAMIMLLFLACSTFWLCELLLFFMFHVPAFILCASLW
jgi:hypothetical protein